MKKIIAIILAILAMVFVYMANFTWVGIYLGKPIIHAYWYESSDGEFTVCENPEKITTLGYVKEQFEEYKVESEKPDEVLYRTFRRNPFLVYEWYDYLTHERWSYPYKKREK